MPIRIRMVLFLLPSHWLLLGGCGGESDDDGGGVPAASGKSAQAADETTFPQTVEHNFGSTTVTKKPERVADRRADRAGHGAGSSATSRSRDRVVRRAAVRRLAVGPGSARRQKPTVLDTRPTGSSREDRRLRPDLIIGVNSGMKEGRLRASCRRSPTIPAGKGSPDFFSAWDQQVELISRHWASPRRAAGYPAGQGDYAKAAADTRVQEQDRHFVQNASTTG